MRAKLYVSFLIVLLYGNAHAGDSKEETLQPPICRNDAKGNTPIDENGYVRIGGIDQWLTIKGDSCKNPVVLFIHGGPGNPLSPYADSLYGTWRPEFTLVQWDQRSSGKTFEANQEPGELTIEKLNRTKLDMDTMVKDGLEVTDFLLEALDKDKVIITGGSWGSVLAVKMIDRKPEKYHFYVGLSQLVNYKHNVLTSYNSVLEKAKEIKDSETIGLLVEMGPPPWESPRNFGKLRRVVRNYEALACDPGPEWKPAQGYADQAAMDAYYSGEEFSFVKFTGLKGDGMAADIDLDEESLRFEIPIYLIQGKEDLLTIPSVTVDYFNKIEAPSKKLVTVERAGHDPNHLMLEAHLKALQDGVAALSISKDM